MRYRKQDSNDDYSFGHQQADFFINAPDGVAQAIKTRLRMYLKEWWVDLSQGTPWKEKIYGKTTAGQRDAELQARILGTDGVNEIVSYASSQTADRQFTIQVTVDTIYGTVNVSEVF